MRLFRIAQKPYVRDLSGDGARLYGGRWNKKGSPVLYTSESRSLATVEYLVHLPLSVIGSDVCLAEMEIPDSAEVQTVPMSNLPKDWRTYPAPVELAEIGERWLTQGKSLVLKVPSVVVRNEWNYLLNPRHSAFSSVKIVSVEEYRLDPRLLKK